MRLQLGSYLIDGEGHRYEIMNIEQDKTIHIKSLVDGVVEQFKYEELRRVGFESTSYSGYHQMWSELCEWVKWKEETSEYGKINISELVAELDELMSSYSLLDAEELEWD